MTHMFEGSASPLLAGKLPEILLALTLVQEETVAERDRKTMSKRPGDDQEALYPAKQDDGTF